MALPINEIIRGDCLRVMAEWRREEMAEREQVDLVFGSPPYEDVRTYGIDFNLKGQDWVDWMVEVVKASLAVCKGLVAFVVEGKTRKFSYSGTPLLLGADLIRAGVTLRKPPAFHRVGIPGSGGPDWFRNDYEFVICATNGGKLPWSDNTAMGQPPKWAPGGAMSYRMPSGRRVAKVHNKRMRRPDRMELQGYIPPQKANPGNVIKCKVGGGLMGSKLAHENEASFPETLAEWFIRSFCPPNGIVLDPFSGSGTTAATAIKHGRRFIGIDVRESQVELAGRRLKEARNGQRGLFDG